MLDFESVKITAIDCLMQNIIITFYGHHLAESDEQMFVSQYIEPNLLTESWSRMSIIMTQYLRCTVGFMFKMYNGLTVWGIQQVSMYVVYSRFQCLKYTAGFNVCGVHQISMFEVLK